MIYTFKFDSGFHNDIEGTLEASEQKYEYLARGFETKVRISCLYIHTIKWLKFLTVISQHKKKNLIFHINCVAYKNTNIKNPRDQKDKASK